MEYSKGMGNREVSATAAQYHSDDDIRILNMISWKNINHPLFFGGGIVKKKFYPDPFSSAVPMYKPGETTPVYVVTRGYFSSIRPGVGPVGAQRSGAKAPEDDRLFLNVNPTTLIFFPERQVARLAEGQRESGLGWRSGIRNTRGDYWASSHIQRRST